MRTDPSLVAMTEPKGFRAVAHSNALRSTLLLFLVAFPVYFMILVFHEGGHALHTLAVGGPVALFYVHPFPMAGYVRPIFDWNNVWFHVAGPALVLLVSLLVFTLFWKRRSVSRLPLVMFFPWTALMQGIVILSVMDDFNNIVQITGISPIILRVTGSILTIAGIFLFVSIFPLLGLDPRNLQSLLLIPIAFFLWAVVGLVAGTLFVPGSPAEVVYDLGEKILATARISLLLYMLFGVVLAGIYVTLYRRARPRLPAWLQTETVQLAWKDLRLPSVLAFISVIFGILMIA